MVIRASGRKGGGFDLAEYVKVGVIGCWNLGNKISIFRCERTFEMGVHGFGGDGISLARGGLEDAGEHDGLRVRAW